MGSKNLRRSLSFGDLLSRRDLCKNNRRFVKRYKLYFLNKYYLYYINFFDLGIVLMCIT